MKYIAYLVTAASIVGTIANSLQKRWCFYVWAVTNTFWMLYNAYNTPYAQSLLYVFNLVMAVVGLRKWKGKR